MSTADMIRGSGGRSGAAEVRRNGRNGTGHRLWTGLWVAILLLAGAASASFAGLLPADLAPWLRPLCAGPLLLVAALPFLVIASPREPSWFKLLVLAGLLSTPWLALLFYSLRAILPDPAALAATFAVVALSAPLCRRRSLSGDPIGRPAAVALASGVLLALLLLALFLAQPSGARLLQPGVVWHVGVVQALGRGLVEHPWLAGTPLPTHPGYAALAFVVSRCLDVSEPSALAALQVGSVLLVPGLLYLWAAPLWREPRRVLAVPLVALFAWNALPAARSLVSPGSLGPEPTWQEWLAHASPGAPPGQVLYGLAAWLQPGPCAPGLTLAVGAWMCAAHALRHGQRPWVGLCALLHGCACLVHPALGAGALVATLVTALVHPGIPAVRPKLSLALLFGALPGLALARLYTPWSAPVRAVLGPPSASGSTPFEVQSLWLPGAASMLLASGLIVARTRRPWERADRTQLLCALFACVVLASMPFLSDRLAVERAELWRGASVPLALLAAGGWMAWIDRRGWRRVVGLGLGVLLLVGGARSTWHVVRGFRAAAGSVGFATDDGGQAGVPGETGQAGGAGETGEGDHRVRNLAGLYRWLRTARELRGHAPILVREVAEGRGRIATETTPHPAALATDLPMWCDRPVELAFGSRRHEPRLAQVHSLFNAKDDWNPRVTAEWESLGRPIVFVVEEADRRRTHRGDYDTPDRGVELRLLRLGARLVKRVGDAAAFVLDPPGRRAVPDPVDPFDPGEPGEPGEPGGAGRGRWRVPPAQSGRWGCSRDFGIPSIALPMDLLLTGLLCLVPLHDAGQDADAHAADAAHSAASALELLREARQPREEFFLMETVDPDPRRGSGRRPMALALLRQTPHKRGPIREREVRFADGPIHLQEVENTQAGRPRAIWRERGTTFGRTWLAIWDGSLGALETTHWGPVRETHLNLPFLERPWMPLELLEACRVEWIDGETFTCLDSLAADVTEIEISTRALEPGERAGLLESGDPLAGTGSDGETDGPTRLVEWDRCDGSSAGRFLFAGERLVAFQWQAGSPWALRISKDTYEQVRASWFPDLADRTQLLEVALERLRRRSL